MAPKPLPQLDSATIMLFWSHIERAGDADRTYTLEQLANRYQVTEAAIQAIVYRRTWKHIS